MMNYESGIRNYGKSSWSQTGVRHPSDPVSAEEIVNKWPKEEIEKILREFGEERFAKRIAEKIAEKRKQRPIKTTFQLTEIIKQTIPKKFQKTKIHPATKTFQALRIAVNAELENLKKVMPQTLEILEQGGRLTIISFHSLEDRIVKKFFKEQNKKGLVKIITKKPIVAKEEETIKNPRSRSAKLRTAVRV